MNKNDIKINSEENVNPKNRREFVKNIIIVFLLIMLVLTFFSNTIMNYSLPEVSVTRMSRDSVSKKYQLDLSVEANKTYKITADESRTVKRVAVKRGQDVKEGQVLFYLEEVKDSAEAKALQEQIDEMKLSYSKALMTVSKDYYQYNLAISQARDALNSAIKAKNDAASKPAPVDNSAVIAELLQRQRELSADKSYIEGAQYTALSEEWYNQISEALSDYMTKKSEVETINTALKNIIGKYESLDGMKSSLLNNRRNLEDLERAIKYAQDDITREEAQVAYNRAKEDFENEGLEGKISEAEMLQSEINAKEPLKKESESVFMAKLSEISQSINIELSSVESQLSSYGVSDESSYSQISGDMGGAVDYDAAIKEAQYNLDTAIHALEVQMASDKVSDAQENLDLNNAKKKIEDKEEELNKLLEKQTTSEIKSTVEGVVEDILVYSGQNFTENDELMVINISDDGFTASANVSSDQSRSISKGKEAKVVNNNDKITVTVKSITKNKDDSSKFNVTFNISGDVVAGQSIKVELGEQASSYDKVIPRSAVKEDSSGKFVYAVKSKSTPLGNRYIVEKVSVKIVAEDDTKCAVSGEFGDSADYIITASSKPFSAGDQVRFAEE